MSNELSIIDDIGKRIESMPEVGGQSSAALFNAFKIALRDTPKIGQCTRDSIVACVEKFAALGMSHGEAYYIPRKDKGVMKCTLLIGYTGLITLCAREPGFVSVDTQAVMEGDTFKPTLGTSPKIEHTIDSSDHSRSTKKVTHVYGVVTFANGTKIVEVMDVPQIDKIKNAVYQWEKTPWKYSWKEQARKTVIRNILKRVPKKSDAILDAMQHMNDSEPVDFDAQIKGELGSLRQQVEALESGATKALDAPVVEETRPIHGTADQSFIDSFGDV